MGGPLWLLLLLGLEPAGCSPSLPPSSIAPQAEASTDNLTGTTRDECTARLSGQVVWFGPTPNIADCIAVTTTPSGETLLRPVPHPNRLLRHAEHGGLAEVFVWLERPKGAASLPPEETAAPSASPFPPLRLLIGSDAVVVEQGNRRGRLGLATPGSDIEIASSDDSYHALAGRGAAFFRWPLPVGCGPLRRRLPPHRTATDDATSAFPIVELFDDARRFWTRAYLLLCPHRWAAVTDTDGRFSWQAVPAGEWDLLVWHPSWTVQRQERDPESTLVVRQFYTAPLVRRVKVHVQAGQQQQVRVDLSASGDSR